MGYLVDVIMNRDYWMHSCRSRPGALRDARGQF